MQRYKISYQPIVFALAAALVFPSCKKDSTSLGPDPFYEVTVEGFKVSFTNQTKGATSYRWDFGDGDSSTEESPTHTYVAKGKYVPTLYATSGGITKDASTVLFISKGSAVRMDDNTLSDWDTVTTNVVMPGAGAGNFLKAKYDYDGNNVYVYFEQTRAKNDGEIYDLYIDADNDMTTGLLTGDIPNGAYDVLLEGDPFADGFTPYYYAGDQSSFTYNDAGISDFYTIGASEESGGVLKFEFALKRGKIKGLTGKGMKIGVQVFSAGYAALVAYSPDLASDAFFLDMSE